MHQTDFYVVVPLYNEEKMIGKMLESLVSQSDRTFKLILVDNNSTDQSAAIIQKFIADHPDFAIECIRENQKGTGAAADTGFRHAIDRGAKYIARTDADCLPHPDWIKLIKQAFEVDKLELVVGKIKPRTDEGFYTWSDGIVLPLLVIVAENFGRIIRHGKQFKYPYIMVAGNNLAITAELYERAGGFPRTRIEEAHEDKVLSERVRTLTDRVGKRNRVIVYNSIRRGKRYGYWNTLMWYWDHKYKPAEVDVR